MDFHGIPTLRTTVSVLAAFSFGAGAIFGVVVFWLLS